MILIASEHLIFDYDHHLFVSFISIIFVSIELNSYYKNYYLFNINEIQIFNFQFLIK
jgi:hypothetical protein